ncbi:NAD(P)(+)--arginine ADP-ribosyltransferase 2-like [Narcine bancroftii]|uniref:NAD(P)(+)--arginine ADP-ribosyltransferase 2-like n=1 Tax=Narcine bancroftii TaxID=1343680 RepID=UPI0038319D7A
MAENSAALIFTQSDSSDKLAIKAIESELRKYKDVWKKNEHLTVPKGLKAEYIAAINAYTAKSSLYGDFNKAMRDYGRNVQIYNDKFNFKGFHYLLSVALQKLRQNARLHTFRGVSLKFGTKQGNHIRFGQFASSSLVQQKAEDFTNKNSDDNTIFEIDTKLGVPIEKYSEVPDQEEVLIPPTEMFEVTALEPWKEANKLRGQRIHLRAIGCKGTLVTLKEGKVGGSLEANLDQVTRCSTCICVGWGEPPARSKSAPPGKGSRKGRSVRSRGRG